MGDSAIVEKILNTFEETQSIKRTAKEAECSWHRVVKILSSSGVLINETHRIILNFAEKGEAPEQIAKHTGYSVATVRAYLPAQKPFYKVNPSENAKRIKKCKEKKKKRNNV